MTRAYLFTPVAALLLGSMHPTHDSFSEVRYDTTRRTVVVRIRAFADDLTAGIVAMPPTTPALPSDSAMARYVRATVFFIDRSGRLVPLRWKGAHSEDDAIIMQLEVDAPAGLDRWQLAHALLVERFTDQVNVVRLFVDGRKASLLFTRGDGPKALR